MSLPTSVQAVVFDMDGVLWLSSAAHAQAFQEVLVGEGIRNFEYAPYAGMTTSECLERVFRENKREVGEARIAELAALKSRLARETLEREPPIAAGCLRVLTALRLTRRLALATSASSGTVNLFLEASGCGELFSTVLCGADVGRSKPAPDIYLKSCEYLSVQPWHTLIVEDAVAGVAAGKAAGARVWALPTTSSPEELMEAGADQVIQRLADLL